MPLNGRLRGDGRIVIEHPLGETPTDYYLARDGRWMQETPTGAVYQGFRITHDGKWMRSGAVMDEDTGVRFRRDDSGAFEIMIFNGWRYESTEFTIARDGRVRKGISPMDSRSSFIISSDGRVSGTTDEQLARRTYQ